MAKYRHVYCGFWTDSFIETLTPEDRYFYIFLLTNPYTTQIGVYEMSEKKMVDMTGYNLEAVKALLKRFVGYGKIAYNSDTKEIAILNWGKYNLNKGGKPVEDCITSELKTVKDLSLLKMVETGIESSKIRGLYDTFTSRLRDEDKKKIKKKKKKKIKKKNSLSISATPQMTTCDKEPIIDLENPIPTIEQGFEQTKLIDLPAPQQKLFDALPKKNKVHFNDIIEIVDYFNKVKGTISQYANKGRMDQMTRWLNRGYKVDDFKKVIDFKMEELKDYRDGKYLRMETFFTESKFESNLEKALESVAPVVEQPKQDFRLSTNNNYITHCCHLLRINKGYEPYLMSQQDFEEMWNKSALLRNCGDDLWRNVALFEAVSMLNQSNELKNNKEDLKTALMNVMGRGYKVLNNKITKEGTMNPKEEHPRKDNWNKSLNAIRQYILQTTQNEVECM